MKKWKIPLSLQVKINVVGFTWGILGLMFYVSGNAPLKAFSSIMLPTYVVMTIFLALFTEADA